MPFVSQSQRKWMFAKKPAMAKEWASHTPKGAELPDKVGKRDAIKRKLNGGK